MNINSNKQMVSGQNLISRKLQKENLSRTLAQFTPFKLKRAQAHLNKTFLQLAYASRLIVFFSNFTPKDRANLIYLNEF